MPLAHAQTMRLARSSVIVVVAASLAGCTLLANDGPSTFGLKKQAYDRVKASDGDPADKAVDFILVDVNKRILGFLRRSSQPTFAGVFADRRPAPDIRIGVGDTISTTIFEAGAGGLFTPTGVTLSQGNFVTLPEQEVDGSGRIKAPYAGWIEVVGRRAEEIEREIEEKLKNRAIEPQVVISVANRTANLVSVLGDVDSPGRFNIGLGRPRVDRVLDAISAAGGNDFQDYETLVTLQRGNTTATARLSAITRDPANDVYLVPGDVIFVQRSQQFFTVFGATGQSNRFVFDKEQQHVADGLARAGGMQDDIADPRWLVLYRPTPRRALEEMGAKIPEKYASARQVPTVYRFNLRNPDGFFYAKNVPMRHNDLLYVSNAPIIGWLKLNSYILSYTTTITDLKDARDAVDLFGVTN